MAVGALQLNHHIDNLTDVGADGLPADIHPGEQSQQCDLIQRALCGVGMKRCD